MKHNYKITFLLLGMFILTQFIGLYVVNHYSDTKIVNGNVVNVSAPDLPLGLETQPIKEESDFYSYFSGLIFAFIFAIIILFLLSHIKAAFILKIWFFSVVIIALTISLNAIFPAFEHLTLISVLISLPLAFFKIYKPNFWIHNLTELLIYPGIAAVFIPILNVYTLIGLLILISIYDMWAVWHSGIMQKMAKYQIEQLRIFSGFFIPYMSKEVRQKMQLLKKSKSKSKNNKGLKVNVAILGGGDVVFPIISAGVVLKTLGVYPALLVVLGATLGLSYLLFLAEKKKFYPAMPFISAGILLAIVISYLIW